MRGKSLSVMALSLLATAAAASAAESPYRIQLLEKSWTPAAGGSVAERGALSQAAVELAAEGRETIHLLVQLHQIPTEDQKLDLWRQGLDLGVYVPGNAFIAAVPVADLASVTARRDVRWATHWSADRKIHPNLRAGDVAPWTRDPERPEWVMIMVLLHHDVDSNRIYDAGRPSRRRVHGPHRRPSRRDGVAARRGRRQARQGRGRAVDRGGRPRRSPRPTTACAPTWTSTPSTALPTTSTAPGCGSSCSTAARCARRTRPSTPAAGSRVTVIDATAISSHSTHVAGTVGGDGAARRAPGAGAAWRTGATILSAGYQQTGGTMLFWDNAGDIEADYALARNTHNADLGTNSIGSNTAANGYPCVREGDYGVTVEPARRHRARRQRHGRQPGDLDLGQRQRAQRRQPARPLRRQLPDHRRSRPAPRTRSTSAPSTPTAAR